MIFRVLEMICSNCDAPMPDVSAFCPACGQSVAPAVTAADAGQKILGALAYIGVILAIILLLIPALRTDRFVRFHAWQSILFSVSSILIGLALRLFFVVFSLLPVVGFLLAWLSMGIGSLAIFMLWIVLVVKAAQGQHYELPLIGPIAAQLSSRADS
jgi:uncharacterized membrane protein